MRRGARIRTHVVVAVTVLLAALALAGSMKGAPPGGVVFWCVACLAGELLWFRLPLDRATVSMGACFNFAALLVLDRGPAIDRLLLLGAAGRAAGGAQAAGAGVLQRSPDGPLDRGGA